MIHAEDIGNTAILECNSHGILLGNTCICNNDYKERLDCAISTKEYEEEKELASILINDIKEMNDKESSILKNSIIIQAVINIVKNSDLLNDIDRITARTLLEGALSNGGIININDLAKGINSMAAY